MRHLMAASVFRGLLRPVCRAQNRRRVSALLVLSKQDHTLAIVDPASLHVVASVPVGDDPHEVIASADGHTAYVSNYGFGAFHTLAVIDLVGQKQMASIDLGALRGPHGLTSSGQGVVHGRSREGHRQLRSGDRQNRLDHGYGPEPDPHDLCISRGKRIVTTNVNSATVTILDKTEGTRGNAAGAAAGNASSSGPGRDRPAAGRACRHRRAATGTETVIPVGTDQRDSMFRPTAKRRGLRMPTMARFP